MKALYRKYRPKLLSEVVGQEQVTKPLSNSLKQGKVSHAYLFIGPRGCGKTTVARILAHEVNDFKYELEDDYVDIIEIDGASNRGIDNIRELREKVMIAPTSGKYKVYIIDEVHMLTKEAFNALLKTLEEPPEHVIFIMATTDAYKVPITITSRTQTYTFKLADKAVMLDFLKSVCEKEKIKIADDALEIIAKRGGGSFRDSLSLLDQISTLSDKEITKELVVNALGLPEDEKINDLLDRYINGDINGVTGTVKDLLLSGIKPETLAEEMTNIIIENPKPELVSLLSKLIEVKSPFAEARLLVALMPTTIGVSASSSGSRPSGPSPRADGANSRAAALRKSPSSETSATPAAPATPDVSSSFSWEEFLQKVKELNDAIYLQLLKTEHQFSNNVLDIYPNKKIVYTILSRDNNKKILIDAAGGIKIVVHAADEKPENMPKNETLAKISDIMGGEVIDDGGRSPF
ncbi:DNA polymerase III subunit gamma/tau [Candidatus Saccharibacteria bacterium]|nr:DNA polymerase III subunit gamma/tau [Candidatus Saccharibacteria bacterium]